MPILSPSGPRIVTMGGPASPYVGSPVVAAPAHNEPAGLSAVFSGHPTTEGILVDGSETFFDYTGAGGSDLGATFSFGVKWDDGPRINGGVTEAGSPHATVLRKRFLIDDVGGWNGLANDDQWADDYEKLYFREIFKFSANYEFHSSTEKYWFWGKGDSSQGSSFYFGQNNRGGDRVLALKNQTSDGGDVGDWESTKAMTKDVWHKAEVIVTAQSVVGAADGIFQVFFNDEDITSDFSWLGGGSPTSTTMEWYDSGSPTRLFSGCQLFEFYGGSGDPKTVNDHIDIGEFYISGLEAAA